MITAAETWSAFSLERGAAGTKLLTKCAAPVLARAADFKARAGTDVTDDRAFRVLAALTEREAAAAGCRGATSDGAAL